MIVCVDLADEVVRQGANGAMLPQPRMPARRRQGAFRRPVVVGGQLLARTNTRDAVESAASPRQQHVQVGPWCRLGAVEVGTIQQDPGSRLR